MLNQINFIYVRELMAQVVVRLVNKCAARLRGTAGIFPAASTSKK
jgi:hypothetical protein